MLTLLQSPTVTAEQPARDRILWTAYGLFYSDGIRATGVDRVIAESGVTKVTFYRHFPSKTDLIDAFLNERHARWMAWFDDALTRHGNGPQALAPALSEWLDDEGFRGCAFLNSMAELGAAMPEVGAITRRHKQDMAQRIAQLLPASPQRDADARMLGLLVDGTIVHAQFEGAADEALRWLAHAVALLQAGAAPSSVSPP